MARQIWKYGIKAVTLQPQMWQHAFLSRCSCEQ